MTTRRDVLLQVAIAPLLIGAAWVARAQTRKPFRIGYLAASSEKSEAARKFYDALVSGLRDLGYVEGRDFVMERRFAESSHERLPDLASQLVRDNVDVIVSAGGSATTRAAQQASRSIPIVHIGGDPVQAGFAASLARPGANVTGLGSLAADLASKQVELIVAAVPKTSRLALLINPDRSAPEVLANMESAAKKYGLAVTHAHAKNPEQFASVFETLARDRPGALVILPDAVFNTNAAQLAQLALKYRLPTMGPLNIFAEQGVLMAYGRDLSNEFRRAATYVDKILKGAKAADLPIEQARNFDLVINLKTAKALGLSLPRELLLRADKVIE